MKQPELEKIILDSFGLNGLYAGIQTFFENKKVVGRLWVDFIWIVEVSQYFLHKNVTVIGVKAQDMDTEEMAAWHKGLMLIPPFKDPLDRKFAGNNPLVPVNLNWPHPMVEALQSVSIMPYASTMAHGEGNQHYKIHTYTEFQRQSYIEYHGMPQSENLKILWASILQTISDLADAYNDEEIHEFFRKSSQAFWD